MAFTKNQVEFIKHAFTELFGERKFIEISWYAYKAHSHPLEADIRTLKNDGVHYFEYKHMPGTYGFSISTSHGVTDSPSDFKSISIDASNYMIHFRYNENDKAKIYRAFKLLIGEDGVDNSRKWQKMMKESRNIE